MSTRSSEKLTVAAKDGAQFKLGDDEVREMSDRYAVKIIEEGRSGRIRYSEGLFHAHEFYWEFGGGEAVVLISIPTPGEWPTVLPWAAERRAEVLDRVATEVCRERCRNCRPVVADAWLEILQPMSAVPPNGR